MSFAPDAPLNSQTELVLIAAATSVNARVDLAKMPEALLRHGFSVRYLGWERISGELNSKKSAREGLSERSILRGGGYVNDRVRFMYPVWMISVFFHVLLLGYKRTILCVGWETAFPAHVAALVTRSRIVFYDADRFSMILNLPKALLALLQILERWTSRKSVLHVIPGRSRYEWNTPNMFVLRNSPSSKDLTAAKLKAVVREDRPFTIYLNGWLGHTRGAPIFLKALKKLECSEISFCCQVAGRIDSPEGASLIEHPLVKYHGEVSQIDALAIYAEVDVVLTYYDPSVPINRKAEPNKWGDCVYFGTPFIVNSEVETAQEFVDAGAAFSVPYNSVAELTDLLIDLASNKHRMVAARTALNQFQPDYPPYEEQFDALAILIKKNL